ncbi:MAG: hypothetical protein ACYTBJ_00895 [Planctomycetota bacterium]|jgi:hypothetical protein
MAGEQNERLAVVETKIDHVIMLLENHMDQPSCQECKLGDDMAVCQNDVKWMKRIGYSAASLSIATMVTVLVNVFTG